MEAAQGKEEGGGGNGRPSLPRPRSPQEAGRGRNSADVRKNAGACVILCLFPTTKFMSAWMMRIQKGEAPAPAMCRSVPRLLRRSRDGERING